jgi:hypothetical protein
MPHRHDRPARQRAVSPRRLARARRATRSPRERHLSRGRVQDLVDGEIPRPAETSHLRSCARCAHELRVYQRLVALVRDVVWSTPGLRRCLTDTHESQE